MKTKTSTFVFSSSNMMGRRNVTLKRKVNSFRSHQVCPLVVHMAEASSPSGWSGHALCSHSQPQKSSWAGQNVPCMSNKSLCVGWPAIPICWCRHAQCRCTWTEDALAGCGCCICPSSLLGDEKDSFEIWRSRDKETSIILVTANDELLLNNPANEKRVFDCILTFTGNLKKL